VRVALSIWEGRIAPVFDVSREVELLTIDDGAVTARHRASITTPTAAEKASRLQELGVETLICGAISAPLQQELSRRGLRIIGFVAGDAERIVKALIAGNLPNPAFAMPGCGGRRLHIRGGAGSGGQGRRWGRNGRQ
jgi:predicted Fe-Mo cluster-binding NifX family protein